MPRIGPTYRKDMARSGFTDQELLPDLGLAWEVNLPGPLSAVSIAAGKLFVSQVDAHTLHALDHATGKSLWHFTGQGADRFTAIVLERPYLLRRQGRLGICASGRTTVP